MSKSGSLSGAPKRRVGVLSSCTSCVLVSTKGSRKKKAWFAGHGGGLPLRRDRESRGRAERSKAFEASTSRPIMNEQYEWAARGSGFVKTSLLFSDDLTRL